jgi:hypothetical protein
MTMQPNGGSPNSNKLSFLSPFHPPTFFGNKQCVNVIYIFWIFYRSYNLGSYAITLFAHLITTNELCYYNLIVWLREYFVKFYARNCVTPFTPSRIEFHKIQKRRKENPTLKYIINPHGHIEFPTRKTKL